MLWGPDLSITEGMSGEINTHKEGETLKYHKTSFMAKYLCVCMQAHTLAHTHTHKLSFTKFV